jgi:hypothetical protein
LGVVGFDGWSGADGIKAWGRNAAIGSRVIHKGSLVAIFTQAGNPTTPQKHGGDLSFAIKGLTGCDKIVGAARKHW